MARVRKIFTRIGGAASPRIVKQRTAGEPRPKAIQATFPKTVTRRVQKRRQIKTLIKVDQTVGMSTKDSQTISIDSAGNKIANGVDVPGGGGFKGATEIIKARPTSTRPAKGTKRVATPRPAPGGVRNPRRLGRGT